MLYPADGKFLKTDLDTQHLTVSPDWDIQAAV